jgi:hypothetical protein
LIERLLKEKLFDKWQEGTEAKDFEGLRAKVDQREMSPRQAVEMMLRDKKP